MQTFESAAGQYVRRIGYTTGAFELARFGWILQQLAQSWPKTRVQITADIASQHDVKEKYARGILDFAESLDLVRHTGESYAPTWKGLAYIALLADESWPAEERPYFFRRVLEADSDYSINILSLVDAGCSSSKQVEDRFLHHIVDVIELRRHLTPRIAESRRFEYRTTLEQASISAHTSAGLPLPRDLHRRGPARDLRRRRDTARHHVRPRIGWLSYLGLIDKEQKVTTTDAGLRLLQEFERRGYRDQSAHVVLPPVEHLMTDAAEGFSHDDLRELTVEVYAPGAPVAKPSPSALLGQIADIYDRIRIPGFNQASTDAIAEVLELHWLAQGHCIRGADAIASVLDEFPDHFSKLRSSGRLAFISLRKLPAS